jgi:L-alanine-DL-glutamate epimerase-like enolase superfamily enzyme
LSVTIAERGSPVGGRKTRRIVPAEISKSARCSASYASTYPSMGQPRDYADHALAHKTLGYTAYKIHPFYYWDPATRTAVPGRPSHLDWDREAGRLVREAVHDDMVLMSDPWGTYHSVANALRVGRELERLRSYLCEHPMPEHRVETYIMLGGS